ncbi:MAG: hypothetical protein KME23_28450 [Goleter apudmare HA4340-LM2]|nr:hypothetical protein [Goleter apudmare HA4340-LM2]
MGEVIISSDRQIIPIETARVLVNSIVGFWGIVLAVNSDLIGNFHQKNSM